MPGSERTWALTLMVLAFRLEAFWRCTAPPTKDSHVIRMLSRRQPCSSSLGCSTGSMVRGLEQDVSAGVSALRPACAQRELLLQERQVQQVINAALLANVAAVRSSLGRLACLLSVGRELWRGARQRIVSMQNVY